MFELGQIPEISTTDHERGNGYPRMAPRRSFCLFSPCIRRSYRWHRDPVCQFEWIPWLLPFFMRDTWLGNNSEGTCLNPYVQIWKKSVTISRGNVKLVNFLLKLQCHNCVKQDHGSLSNSLNLFRGRQIWQSWSRNLFRNRVLVLLSSHSIKLPSLPKTAM